jgi:hypothetical protein
VKWLFGVGVRDTRHLAESLTLKYGSSAGFAPFTSQPAVRQLDRATSLVIYMQIEQTRRGRVGNHLLDFVAILQGLCIG